MALLVQPKRELVNGERLALDVNSRLPRSETKSLRPDPALPGSKSASFD